MTYYSTPPPPDVWPAPLPAPKRSKRPLILVGFVIAAVVGVVLAFTLGQSSGTSSIAVHGTMTLTDTSGYGISGSAPCEGTGGYSDITDGAEVVISDDTGRTLAITQLTGGAGAYGVCTFDFTAAVPAGKKYYGITVTHRGTVKFPESDVATATVSLGN